MARTKATVKKKDEIAEQERERLARSQMVLTLIENMAREKGVSREVIFTSIEQAIESAMERAIDIDDDILIHIDRQSGEIIAQKADQLIDPEFLGRIATQAARQVMTQRIREAESEGVFSDFNARKGELVSGSVLRVESGTYIISVAKDGKVASGNVEAILPKSETIPGETHAVGDRLRAVVHEVKKSGTRVKIVLSRTSPEFVKALFEQIIPEIQDRTIEIRSVAREPGYRSKVAVSSIDSKVDAVGACVGVRGSRIKEVIDELNQERIDIVRWNDSMQVMIPNALQPAEVEDVQLYPRLNQAIVLVDEKNLSLAIGKRGQNVRLASKLVNWNIDVMTVEELTRDLEKAERYFSRIPNMTPEVMEILITEGFFTYASLSYLTAEDLAEMTGLDPEVADDMIEYAEDEARRIEREGEPEWANPPEPEPEPEPENQTTAEEGSGESQGEEQIVGFAEPEEATPPPPQTAESSPPPAEPTPIEGDINSLFAPEPIKEETKPENESGDQK